MEINNLTIALGSIIGLIMGLTGAGGGVLAIPLLVFGLHLPLQQAAPVGLIAVGIAAALGAAFGLRQGIVRYRAAAIIGGSGMLMAPCGVVLAHLIPNRFLLAFFSLVLMYTALRMLRPTEQAASLAAVAPCRVEYTGQRLTWTFRCARALVGTGLVSGLLSGLLGVGGGFVIIPALTRYTDLDIRSIQATSLAVIALVSLSGASAAALSGAVSWSLALFFAGGAMLGLLSGRLIANKLHPTHLQQAFAWFTLAIALLMLARAFGLKVS